MINHFYQSIQGWFDFEILYSEMVRLAPQKATFVEIGAWKGKSTAYMAVEIMNSGKDIDFYVVDTWKGNDVEEEQKKEAAENDVKAEFLANMKSGGVDSIIKVVQGSSTCVAQQFEDGSLDFVFIDGSHDYTNVFADIKAWLPKVKKDGFIGGHDYDTVLELGVVKAVNELVPSRSLGWGCCWLVGPTDKIKDFGNYAPWGLIGKS